MSLLEAAAEAASFLEEQGVAYAIIGGLALQQWGEPRATQDVDIVVLVPTGALETFLRTALERFHPRIPDALDFAYRHHVLLLQTADGIAIDLSLGIPGYEAEAMRRAVVANLPGLRPVRIVSAEDLIIHKCVAGRPRDVEDVERVLLRQSLAVDLRYIRRWLKAFAPIVDTHDVVSLFEAPVRKVRSALRRPKRP